MKKTAFIGGLLLCTLLLYSADNASAQTNNQSGDDVLSEVSVPSPTVSALSKFTDVPVSLYTGLADVSIPIYEIKTGKLSLPITLRYQTGGIKVEENSSNVGLGWSLDAGGSITQIVMGMKDDGSYQSNGGLTWVNAGLLPDHPADYELLRKLAANGSWATSGIDGVPDVYMYNTGKESGRFIFADGVTLLPKTNIAVNKVITNGFTTWKLVDGNGIQYYYQDEAVSTNHASTSLSSSSSWMISKIVDANHTDSIEFFYTNTAETGAVGRSYSGTAWQDIQGNGIGWESTFEGGTLHAYTEIVQGKQLTQIKFINGTVNFDIAWNDREDIGSGGAGGQIPRIKNIFVKDNDNNIVKVANFNQDYYTTNSPISPFLGKRMRLQNISFAGSVAELGTDKEAKYAFTYNNILLPVKNSNGMDHWGYYNGKNTNETLVPDVELSDYSYTSGADRETNSYYVTAGLLEKITYPTGGTASFEFEANTVGPNAATMISFNNVILNAQALGATGDFTEELSTYVDVPVGEPYTNGVSATFEASMGIGLNSTSEAITHAAANAQLMEVTGVDGSGSPSTVTKKSFSFAFSPTNNYTKTEQVILSPGKRYYIKVKIRNQGFSINGNLAINWPSIVPSPNRFVGGCRIKKITMFDPYSNASTIKTYSYNYPDSIHSSGQLAQEPRYYEYIHKFHDPGPDPSGNNTPCDDVNILGISFSSNSVNSIGSGSHVGYSCVTETIGNSGEGGKNIYYYTNFAGTSSKIGEFDASWRRGLLLKIDSKDNLNLLVARKRSTFKFRDRVTYAGHTASVVGEHPCGILYYQSAYPVYFSQNIYTLPSEWVVNDSVSSIDYTTNISTIEVNNYDNPQHQQITKSSTFVSDGSKITTSFRYPTDFTLTSAPMSAEVEGIKILQDKHIFNIPIEQYVQKWVPGSSDALTLSASYTGFRKTVNSNNSDVILMNDKQLIDINEGITDFQPMSISANTLERDPRYSQKVFASEYDSRANLVGLQTDNNYGNKGSGYIWGYNKTSPIAVFQNNYENKTMAFTSFEKNADGNWTYNSGAVINTDFFTGKYCLNLSATGSNLKLYFHDAQWSPSPTAAVPPLISPIEGRYIVSYWHKSGSVLINNNAPTKTGITAQGWTYCEHLITDPASIDVTGSGLIDELRFYPESSLVLSYTYNPLVGVTSADDPSSKIIFYDYDSMGRLSQERDVFGNVLKKYTYQYQGPQ